MKTMYALYRYAMGLKFQGIVANTVDEILQYLDKTYGKDWNRDAFEIKEIKCIYQKKGE